MISRSSQPRRVAVIGAGWAGLAAAVRAVQLGHRVSLFEAARQPGGRARSVPATLPDGREVVLDNGQHILIGAYTDTLALMRTVGVDPERALLRRPLALCFPDGSGLRLPDWPAPLDAAWGIARARGWRWGERLALLRTALGWRRAGFTCDAAASVADLCATLPPRLQREFIEPLCVSALNTPMAQASGTVFLRVLKDALFSQRGSSHLLLPRVPLGELLPEAALRWLTAHGAAVHLGERAGVGLGERAAVPLAGANGTAPTWAVAGQPFDAVLLAVAAQNVAPALAEPAQAATEQIATQVQSWQALAAGLRYEAITTVYAQAAAGGAATLPLPMLALRPDAQHPAQFVFDRDAITGDGHGNNAATRLLAFVVSASDGERAIVEAAVVRQARAQLGLAVTPVRTLTEKRATFACTPALVRPPQRIAPGLLACGDYVQGPYPATLEGAVRSGLAAVEALG